ncbi:signal peptidase II [Candidatus Parcubacteria bacterium]|nr:signal peptidase II [Candidatus Parcubacteria bacterium]
MIGLNKKMAWILSTAVFFVVLDRLLKACALKLGDKAELSIIGDWLTFNPAINKYIAFSLPLSGSVLITSIIAILFMVLIIAIKQYQSGHIYNAGLLSVIFLGAASNLYDRFKYQGVIDYFNLKYFSVFNLADSLIVVSVFLLIFLSIKKDFNKAQ